MALLVNARIRGQALTRMAFFTPTVLPMVAVANIWMFFYAPDYGLIDQLLRPFGLGGNNWLGSPGTALGALIVITIWKEAGFFMIFYLAALQQISPTLIEAAELEGATYWQRLRRIILPLLMPTTLFICANAIIGAFRLVDHVFAMTKGGPDNATMLLLYYIYQVGFSFWDTGCGGTDRDPAAEPGAAGAVPVRLCRPQGSLPMRTERARFAASTSSRWAAGCWRSCGCRRCSTRVSRRSIRPNTPRASICSRR